jgi:hypothetical protein
LARRDFRGALARLTEGALALVTPENAWAGGVGTGGKVKSFSPFGGVDTNVVVEAAAPVFQLAPTGSAVPVAPKVVVHTTGAGTLLDGATVTFSVAAGGGTVLAIGAAGPSTSAVATTDLTGTAAVANWTVDAGANSLNAAAAFPAPASGTGVGISGSPVVFSATGGDLIPWQASGYKYLGGAAGSTPGFEAPGFNDAGWSVGQAGFGSATPNSLICTLDATVATPWALGSTDAPSDMLLRHTFTLPAGWTSDLVLSVAIDNDIQVFVNGNDVTSTVYPAATITNGMVTHEGCATRGSSSFSISHTLLNAGTNVIAIRARDRGVDAFVDANLTVAAPIQ